MRNVNLGSGLLVLALIGLLTACVLPAEESSEIPVELSDIETSELEILETTAEPDEDSSDLSQCLTTTCTPGAQGNQYCTQLCGDTAWCFSSGYGCGPRPCCVLM